MPARGRITLPPPFPLCQPQWEPKGVLPSCLLVALSSGMAGTSVTFCRGLPPCSLAGLPGKAFRWAVPSAMQLREPLATRWLQPWRARLSQ